MSDDEIESAPGTQRLDKWLWFVRLVKSRTLAAGLVSEGKVRINRVRIDKPSHAVRRGDVITATAHSKVRVLRVTALGERRGPPAEARTLYEELTEPSPGPRSSLAAAGGSAGSRPNKKERRELTALKRGESDT